MTWHVSIEGLPFTMNEARRMNPFELRAAVKEWREAAGWAARQARVPRLESVIVAVIHERRDGRSMPDIGACAFAVKAAVDGLVDAGVIPDDTPQHLRALTFLPPVVTGRHALTLTIEAEQ